VIATLRWALVAGTLVAVTACSEPNPTSDTDALDAVDAAIPAAIRILAAGCSPSPDLGSGSMIDTDLAITAAHVVAGATDVRVAGADGEPVAAEVVMFDPALDLAALRTAQPIGTALTVGERPDADDRGAIVTYRDRGERSTAVISQVGVVRTVNIDTTDIYLERDVTRPGFEVTAEIESGDSGAIVVLPGGIATGMIWARSTARNDRAWAIDLPDELADTDYRASLTDSVAVGECVG
jgi:S1-C subfamily serine protease